jgi:hypothetical protein
MDLCEEELVCVYKTTEGDCVFHFQDPTIAVQVLLLVPLHLDIFIWGGYCWECSFCEQCRLLAD